MSDTKYHCSGVPPKRLQQPILVEVVSHVVSGRKLAVSASCQVTKPQATKLMTTRVASSLPLVPAGWLTPVTSPIGAVSNLSFWSDAATGA